MADSANVNLEKAFFAKILSEPDQFYKVKPHFFVNEQIRIIYDTIREDYINSKNKVVPSPNQIWTMVSLVDTDKKVTKESLKILLKEDLSSYENDWLDTKFKSWKISKHTRDQIKESIDLIKNMDEINYDNVMDIANRLKDKFAEVDSLTNDDNDLGDDFDDPESHKQLIAERKMPSGWSNIDRIMGGGWDHATLNIMMGETNVGKSMWLQNISTKLTDMGYNVVYVTLEMASRKCIKRMGSMRLKIPIDQYDTMSKDNMFIKQKINEIKNLTPTNKLFDGGKPGKLFVKKYPTSDCTITDLEGYIKKFEETKRIKLDVLVIDYINLMSIEKGYALDTMLYLKGKHLAEGLRRIADKYDVCVITATQTDKSVWGASDINLDDIPESKAIAESADSVWAIIRNSQMKKENMYKLKILKLRDGEHHEEQIKFEFNTKYLTMDNDILLGSK